MSATAALPTGHQHECINYGVSVRCERGAGKAPNRKCRGCGSLIVTHTGVWTVQEWRGDGNYSLAGAVSVWATERTAERHITTDTQVVRFILN